MKIQAEFDRHWAVQGKTAFEGEQAIAAVRRSLQCRPRRDPTWSVYGVGIIQQGTIHLWRNRSATDVCRIVFVLTEAAAHRHNGLTLAEVKP